MQSTMLRRGLAAAVRARSTIAEIAENGECDPETAAALLLAYAEVGTAARALELALDGLDLAASTATIEDTRRRLLGPNAGDTAEALDRR